MTFLSVFILTFIIHDGNGNWRIKFLTDGTFITNYDINIDAFLVGGGGGGGRNGGGGGGGGYTLSKASNSILKGVSYSIVIGAGGAGGQAESKAGSAGGTTTAFSLSAAGGAGGRGYEEPRRHGGDGGSGGGGGGNVGGAAGTDGGNGTVGSEAVFVGNGGQGQGFSTREFWTLDNNSAATLYSSGGAGTNGVSGAANTGNGGGGTAYTSTAIHNGGSGIVVIRNHR